MANGLKLKTGYDKDFGQISLRLLQTDEKGEELRDQLDGLTHWLIDTKEAATRQALIEMGWTPPEIPILKPDESEGMASALGKVMKLNTTLRDALKQILLMVQAPQSYDNLKIETTASYALDQCE